MLKRYQDLGDEESPISLSEKQEKKLNIIPKLKIVNRDSINNFLFNIYDKSLDLFVNVKEILRLSLNKILNLGNIVKSYIITKLFWGRGSLYRYIAITAIFIPLALSLFVFYYRSGQTSQDTNKKQLISKPIIENVIGETNSDNGSDGKILESTTTVKDTPDSEWYDVKDGDTLSSIADKYKITQDIIMWANDLSTDKVQTGQRLHIIPIQGLIYTTKPGDTLSNIAKYNGISLADVEDWNALDESVNLTAGKKLLLPGAKDNPILVLNTYNTPQVSANPSAKCPPNMSWCFLQGDPRWGDLVMGLSGVSSSGSGINLKNSGCLVTVVAMLGAKYYPSQNITPAKIASNPNYFAGSGLFRLSEGLGGLFSIKPMGGIFRDVDWTGIDQQLAQGHPVIAHEYYTHWVLITEKQGDQYIINDPARGGGITLPDKNMISEAYLYTPGN